MCIGIFFLYVDGECVDRKKSRTCVLPKGNVIFQPSIFRSVFVSFREGTSG